MLIFPCFKTKIIKFLSSNIFYLNNDISLSHNFIGFPQQMKDHFCYYHYIQQRQTQEKSKFYNKRKNERNEPT